MNEKVRVIIWSGAHMDADSRYLFRTEVFPDVQLFGNYGSTMISAAPSSAPTATRSASSTPSRPMSPSPSSTPGRGEPVPYGARGQVVMNHISRGALFPNNLERDVATRIRPEAGQLGDSVADVSPVKTFDDEVVIEGVY
ncbi:hypothetical protein QA804_43610 [Streptomyces scabiei]